MLNVAKDPFQFAQAKLREESPHFDNRTAETLHEVYREPLRYAQSDSKRSESVQGDIQGVPSGIRMTGRNEKARHERGPFYF
jgi:hypothetical protein